MKSPKIEAAHAISDNAIAEARAAQERLGGPWFANSFGDFTDAGEVHADIRAPTERLNHPLRTIEAAAWPQKGDHDDE